MTYLPEIRDSLAATAAHGAPTSQRRSHRWIRSVFVWAVPSAVALASVAVAVLFITGVRGSVNRTAALGSGTSSRIPRAWRQDNMKAEARIAKHDKGCRSPISAGLQSPQHQSILTSAPAPALASLFGALRRPATGKSRISRKQMDTIGVDGQGIYIRFARQAKVDGVRFYMIPVAHLEPNELPLRCFDAQLVAFRKLSVRLPASQQASAVQYEVTQIRQQQAPQPPGIVLRTEGAGGSGGSFLGLAMLRNHPFDAASNGGNNTAIETFLLVPDTVATITAHYSKQTYPGRVSKPVSVTKRVENNLVMFVFRGAFDPPSLTYRSFDGRVLFSTHRG